MARLLFAALSLAVVHGSSYGKMSNSQPWLPLSDGMPLAINDDYRDAVQLVARQGDF